MESITYSRKALGDFQTPPGLVQCCLDALYSSHSHWTRALEPTCGRGNFIEGLARAVDPPDEIVGIDINSDVLDEARARFGHNPRVRLLEASIFDLSLRADVNWLSDGPLLVVGNPPWVTNSELSAMGSGNVPKKRNIKGLRGVDAITGSANFDIAEYIWLQLLQDLSGTEATIALLCKTSVARNVLEFSVASAFPITAASLYHIDAKKWFGVSADACLLAVELSTQSRPFDVPVYESLDADSPSRLMSFVKHELVADAQAYSQSQPVDGASPLVWRQGIKHDAAQVMELTIESDGFHNRLGEVVDVEDPYIFPLVKGTDLFHGRVEASSRAVIVPQRSLAVTDEELESKSPRLWQYLSRHRDVFDARRSAIYRRGSPFAIFGIGNYSFAPYKVAISGLHKVPRFWPIGPSQGKPVMLDDTSYFLPFESPQEAGLVCALLELDKVTSLMKALVFWDAKRPITKKLLMRVNLNALLEHSDREHLLERANQVANHISRQDDEGWRWPSDLGQFLTDKFATKVTPISATHATVQARLLDENVAYETGLPSSGKN